jgi:hypothetical protein
MSVTKNYALTRIYSTSRNIKTLQESKSAKYYSGWIPTLLLNFSPISDLPNLFHRGCILILQNILVIWSKILSSLMIVLPKHDDKTGLWETFSYLSRIISFPWFLNYFDIPYRVSGFLAFPSKMSVPWSHWKAQVSWLIIMLCKRLKFFQ